MNRMNIESTLSIQKQLSTNYALDNIENFKEEIDCNEFDILFKYNLLTIEYLKFIIENPSISSKGVPYIRFIILRGFETISHVFQLILNYSKNLEMTYYHCQKAFYFYVEFIEQITDLQNSFLKLNSRDACMYVYKKTIFEINNEMRKNSKSCKEIEKFSKKMVIIKKVVCYNINNFEILIESNKEFLLKNIYNLCLKIMNNNLNNKTLQLLDVYINMEKTKPTQYNYFTDIFTFIAKLLKPTK